MLGLWAEAARAETANTVLPQGMAPLAARLAVSVLHLALFLTGVLGW